MAVETKPRKFINNPADLVRESLTGLAAAHGDLLRYDAGAQIVVRKDAPRKGKVALVSGGGSGHEPLHGGVVEELLHRGDGCWCRHASLLYFAGAGSRATPSVFARRSGWVTASWIGAVTLRGVARKS